MNENPKIDPTIFQEIKTHLALIEKEHDVVIIQAIESGSRAWGFPSPDSDYDVRFIYAHPKDWYIQLNERRDVIELPINSELDISGWDLRKALNLANKGNAVIQEWMISPIIYQQSSSYDSLLELVKNTFNPIAAFNHYRSMAKKAYQDIQQSEHKKLKRFFYFSRATLSAQWIVKNQTMPSIIFSDLINGLINDPLLKENFHDLIEQKSHELETSNLHIPATIYDCVFSIYQTLDEKASFDREINFVSSDDFRKLLN